MEYFSEEMLFVEIASITKRLPVPSIKRLLANSEHLSHKNAPPVIYYCNDKNPYSAKFWSDENKCGELT